MKQPTKATTSTADTPVFEQIQLNPQASETASQQPELNQQLAELKALLNEKTSRLDINSMALGALLALVITKLVRN